MCFDSFWFFIDSLTNCVEVKIMAGKNKSKNKIPKGWMKFTNMGTTLTGTKFVPLKTPLTLGLCENHIPRERWFTPQDILQQLPGLKLIINLTQAPNGRYYNYKDFKSAGVKFLQINCEGHGILPTRKKINAFFSAVDAFMLSQDALSNGLIGIHCTHGLNRTGYFICKYLVDRMNMDPNAAIELFETARGHRIERQQYISDLQLSSELIVNKESSAGSVSTGRQSRSIPNWRASGTSRRRRSSTNRVMNNDNRQDGNYNVNRRQYNDDRYSTTYNRNNLYERRMWNNAGYTGTSQNNETSFYGNTAFRRYRRSSQNNH